MSTDQLQIPLISAAVACISAFAYASLAIVHQKGYPFISSSQRGP
jgi:hypothetical protein